MRIVLFIVFVVDLVKAKECQSGEIGSKNPDIDLAKPAQFPFIVGLIGSNVSGRPICTGALVSWQHVLSAAHCLQVKDKPKYCVMGDHSVGVLLRDKKVQKRTIESFRSHPQYKLGSDAYDISVIMVKNRFRHTEFVSTIELTKRSLKVNEPCIAVGYGDPEFAYGTVSEGQLHFEQFQIEKITDGTKAYESKGVKKDIPYEGNVGSTLVDIKLKVLHGISTKRYCKGYKFMSVYGHRYYIWEQLNYYTEQNAFRSMLKSLSMRIRLKINLLMLVFVPTSVETFSWIF